MSVKEYYWTLAKGLMFGAIGVMYLQGAFRAFNKCDNDVNR